MLDYPGGPKLITWPLKSRETSPAGDKRNLTDGKSEFLNMRGIWPIVAGGGRDLQEAWEGIKPASRSKASPLDAASTEPGPWSYNLRSWTQPTTLISVEANASQSLRKECSLTGLRLQPSETPGEDPVRPSQTPDLHKLWLNKSVLFEAAKSVVICLSMNTKLVPTTEWKSILASRFVSKAACLSHLALRTVSKTTICILRLAF